MLPTLPVDEVEILGDESRGRTVPLEPFALDHNTTDVLWVHLDDLRPADISVPSINAKDQRSTLQHLRTYGNELRTGHMTETVQASDLPQSALVSDTVGTVAGEKTVARGVSFGHRGWVLPLLRDIGTAQRFGLAT